MLEAGFADDEDYAALEAELEAIRANASREADTSAEHDNVDEVLVIGLTVGAALVMVLLFLCLLELGKAWARMLG